MTVSFSNDSAVIWLHLSRLRWKFWKLGGPFSTAVHFLAFFLKILKPTDAFVENFSLLLKCCSHNQQTSDCGWRVSIGLPILGKHNIKKIYLGPVFQRIEVNAKYLSGLQFKRIRKNSSAFFYRCCSLDTKPILFNSVFEK